jgi:hypothetical protein
VQRIQLPPGVNPIAVTNISYHIKFKQLDHWQYQYLDTVLELLTDAQKNFKNTDRKRRKLLTIHVQHHPKVDVDRLYVPRKQEGKGLMQSEEAYAAEIKKLLEYVESR